MDLLSHCWHFIGIGGAGMSALADALLDLGASVSGSDAVESEATRDLARRGARVYIGHNPANLADADHVVVTGAVPTDNPELAAAHERGIPVTKRAELVGLLMDTRHGVAVAGTHGKTTTSGMIAWVLARAGLDPAYLVGSSIRGLGAGGHWGGGRHLVAEADEYDRSFLHMRPEVAVITNIETDHLEYYGTPEAIAEAFEQFAHNVRPGGLLVLCSDDPGSRALGQRIEREGAAFRVQYYGEAEEALWRPGTIRANDLGGSDFAVLRDGREVVRVSLRVPGRHNVLNAVAALAACVECGVPPEEAARHLGDFEGTARRFEVKGEAGGVLVVDDYAHHPTEIAATIEAARGRYPGRRLYVLFQPHTYTRTRDFLPDFARVLSAADRVIVSEIYASRERDTLGMSGKQIVERMTGASAEFAPTLSAAREALLDDLAPGDVLLVMGAGDVTHIADEVLAALSDREVAPAIVTAPAAPSRASWTFTPGIASELELETGLRPIVDEPMSKHDSLRVGGPAALFVAVDTVKQLVDVVLFARRRGIPHVVLGNGTNVLVGDYGIDGLVIHNRTRDISHKVLDDGNSVWSVASGVLFSRLARITCEQGWTGLEWSNSVPGSVGGGVISNAGAHGKEIKDDLLSIEVLTLDGEVERWPTERLGLAYRTSIFKAHGHRELAPIEVVLTAELLLRPDTGRSCEARMRTYLEERQAKQPQGKSAGSTFKNPPGYSAGWLVEQVGLKGQTHGRAQFSPKHANFMMNLGGATAADVLALMDEAKRRVKEQFGIELEPEIEFLGES
jgi:UDP-N-acetylmuramate--L-alanine ligase/UDP-N-acetylenolpyruvoylglucosamine reductase